MKDQKLESVGLIFGLASIRQFREALINAAVQIKNDNNKKIIYLALHEPVITSTRLKEEYWQLKKIFQEEVLERIVIAAYRENKPELISDFEYKLIEFSPVMNNENIKMPEGGAPFRLLKILLLHFLTRKDPITIKWLSETAGCSYPITAKFLKELGGVVEKIQDRRIRLNWIPPDELMRLRILAKQHRITFRFEDQSKRGVDPELAIERLAKLNLKNVSIGGVTGAQHYYPELDILNTPRLDLSLFNPGRSVSIDFVNKIDPALTEIKDPDQPADVVVHVVRHPSSMFTSREEGLAWADPMECLLDLFESHFDAQAIAFFNFMKETIKNE